MIRSCLFVLAGCCLIGATVRAQMATAERVEGPEWWPTKPSARADYAGPGECATCHPRQTSTQRLTSMARTGLRAAASDVLKERTPLTFKAGAHSYSIAGRDGSPLYTVTDGQDSRSVPLAWAFGAGKVGQSFLYDREGKLFEARVSYYDTIHALDFTPDRKLESPGSIDEAMARPVDAAEARRCFACHMTGSTRPTGDVDFAALIPGITCEACHGPGRAHVAAMKNRQIGEGRAAIFNPKRLDVVDSVDFCGSCHATFWDVKLAAERGIAALRSQPFRLQSSRCWTQADARLACVACHDPHQPLVRETAAYDERCLACHVTVGTATADHPGRACKAGNTSNCASCHMPKYDVPGMHFRFTDHLIRVTR